jgi:probable O-glycosylation ligase (exosortase A-associated)
MSTITEYQQDASAMGRFNAWSMAWNLALDRVTGGGFYVFTQELFDRYSMFPDDGVRAAHSIYFQVLGEHGFVGLGLFLLAWVLAWRTADWLRANAAKNESTAWAAGLAAMVQVSYAGYFVGGAFLSLAYFDLPYLLAVVLVAARKHVELELLASRARVAMQRSGAAEMEPLGSGRSS